MRRLATKCDNLLVELFLLLRNQPPHTLCTFLKHRTAILGLTRNFLLSVAALHLLVRARIDEAHFSYLLLFPDPPVDSVDNSANIYPIIPALGFERGGRIFIKASSTTTEIAYISLALQNSLFLQLPQKVVMPTDSRGALQRLLNRHCSGVFP